MRTHSLFVSNFVCNGPLVDSLFGAVDIDGSGSIDQYEFRILLRQLDLNYSDKKFNVLFSAIDIEAANVLKKYEFYNLLFPCTKKELRELMQYYVTTEGGSHWSLDDPEVSKKSSSELLRAPSIGNNEKIRSNRRFDEASSSKR